MNIPQEHISAIQSFGYTGSEAQFLYLVATHSGYFTQRHFANFLGQKPGSAVHSLIERALARKHVKQTVLQNNARVYQLFHRPMYRAVEKENLRNRRVHSLEFAKTRLAILDFVLAHPDRDYLETEPQKVEYFHEHFHIAPENLPGRTYQGSNLSPATMRYFVDKFPMFRGPHTPSLLPVVTFTYVDPGLQNLKGFALHLDTYFGFLKRLPRFRFIYACPSETTFAKAQRAFAMPFAAEANYPAAQATKYFALRALWEAGRYERLSNDDLEFLNAARRRFAGDVFETVYRQWCARQSPQGNVSGVMELLVPRQQDISFETWRLPYDYSDFDQNSQVRRKPPRNRFSERVSTRFSDRNDRNPE